MQSWTAWARIWHWYGGFHMCIPLVLFLIDSTFECLLVLAQLSDDPASAVAQATGNQIITVCKAVCEEEKAHILDPQIRNSRRYLPVPRVFPYQAFIGLFMFTELDDLLVKLQWGRFQPARRIFQTTDTSGDESDVSHRKTKVLSKRTYRRKKPWTLG